MRRLLAMVTAVSILGLATHARADEDDWDDEARAEQNAQVSQEQFQQQLAPYGQWEYDNSYGEVFYPSVDAGWRPYVYGRWAWTDYGWMWVSDEPYGWAVYHYGRWWWNPYQHRWGWVPGYEWAPAWVVWRFGATAVGWAPLYVGYDAWSDDYPVYYDHWVYVPCEHFYGGPVYTYVYAPSYVRTVYYNTSSVHGYVGTTSYGPPTTYVSAHSAVPVTTTQVVHSAQPPGAGQASRYTGGPVHVYQPPSTHVYNPTRSAPTASRGLGASRTPVVAPSNVHLSPGVQHEQPRPSTFDGPNTPSRGYPQSMPEPTRQATPSYGQRPVQPEPFQGQNRGPTYNPSQPPQPAYQPGQPNRRQPQPKPQQQPQRRPPAPPSTPHTFNMQPSPIPSRAPMFANAGGFRGQPSFAAPQPQRRPAPPVQKNRR
ncbi:MAG: hypothetical protein JST54_10275 [Deltaproteobacteria bacterium]|nr:hypothetical protein [Deltaproteobacteria bacterium]